MSKGFQTRDGNGSKQRAWLMCETGEHLGVTGSLENKTTETDRDEEHAIDSTRV